VTATKPVLSLQGNDLIIIYDFINYKAGEKYRVELEVTDSKGAIIKTQSVEGDIGDNVEGGKGKKIIWHYTADNVMDEVNLVINIVIKFIAEPNPKPVSVPGRGSLIAQSVILPGLGLTKLTKKPYWLMGVAGYGLVANGVIFNLSSKSNHENYLNTNDPAEEQIYWDKYENHQTISYISFAGAAVIWVTDMILVLRASSKSGSVSGLNKNKAFAMIPEYDLTNKAPVIKLRITF
jgi:hypothetical protein